MPACVLLFLPHTSYKLLPILCRHAGGVAKLLTLAGSCLSQLNGRLIYLGAGTLGVLG